MPSGFEILHVAIVIIQNLLVAGLFGNNFHDVDFADEYR